MRISARVFGCLNPPVRLKHGRIDPFAISRFYGSGVRKPVTVVTSDLLRGRSASDSEETAKPETEQPAAVKPLFADPILFDELNKYPSSISTSDGVSGPLHRIDPPDTETDNVGRGLVDRLLANKSEESGGGTRDTSMSSIDRIEAMQQMREDLDFDTIFDVDTQEVAKLSLQELQELEKARFGPETGEVPEWGLPGPGGKGISRLFPSSLYTLDDAGGRELFKRRKRVAANGACSLCASAVETIDWKNVQLLTDFVGDFGKIKGRRQTGMCGRHQRMVAQGIKRARHMAFMPFVGKIKRSR